MSKRGEKQKLQGKHGLHISVLETLVRQVTHSMINMKYSVDPGLKDSFVRDKTMQL